jgi:REP element-mobilizing transposase RayT
MPRGARLDIVGLLQHVMVRGIERRSIFLDEEDRRSFVGRLSSLLEATETDLLAWALLSNHVHLLLRPRRFPLAVFMRRLLTGYAVTFNLRHKRSGHLFQNRYKSIVCDQDEYLLELVRYIHLNPLRAGLVSSLAELHTYPWSGHAVLMGNRELPGQKTEEVLQKFGRTVGKSRMSYRNFVDAGASQGRREELVGGGLRRSLAVRGDQPGGEREAYDARVLGSGEFVERLWRKEDLRAKIAPPVSIERLIEAVAKSYGLPRGALKWRSKSRPIADARAAACYLAVREAGHKGFEIGAALGLTSGGVSLAIRRGAAIVEAHPDLGQLVVPGVS